MIHLKSISKWQLYRKAYWTTKAKSGILQKEWRSLGTVEFVKTFLKRMGYNLWLGFRLKRKWSANGVVVIFNHLKTIKNSFLCNIYIKRTVWQVDISRIISRSNKPQVLAYSLVIFYNTPSYTFFFL